MWPKLFITNKYKRLYKNYKLGIQITMHNIIIHNAEGPQSDPDPLHNPHISHRSVPFTISPLQLAR